jgi:hypothetical protein
VGNDTAANPKFGSMSEFEFCRVLSEAGGETAGGDVAAA